ncbi:hypothetical protein DIPPA_22799 [Diplonema papillatum]|nr:hypothetical protein DIPPA_22799 [Diplonema papillatum]
MLGSKHTSRKKKREKTKRTVKAMSAGGEALGAGGFPQQASALGRKGAAAVLKRSGSDVSSGSTPSFHLQESEIEP